MALVFTYTGSGQFSAEWHIWTDITAVDTDGEATTFSIVNLAATTLGGGAATEFAGDITITSTGAISANNLKDDRIYEVTVQVLQGSNTFSGSIASSLEPMGSTQLAALLRTATT